MNLVRLQYGGGGGELHGAIISVTTTETSLIGKKVYLYKDGDTTPISNATISSSGSCLFTVLEVGTYTVKASDGTYEIEGSVSIDSEQIINKDIVSIELSFFVTITFDVYSAPNDSIYYYEDDNISNPEITLCTTNADGKGTGSLIVNKYKAKNITFYSTVAKDTTDGASAYNKSISIDSLTSEIYVMPDGAIYWHGYQRVPLYIDKIFENINGTYSINTNNIIIGIKSSYSRVTCQTNDLIDLSKYTKLRMLSTATGSSIKILYTSYQKGNAGAYSHREDAVSYPTGTNQITDLNLTKTASPINCCVSIANSTTANSGECIIYALWLE